MIHNRAIIPFLTRDFTPAFQVEPENDLPSNGNDIRVLDYVQEKKSKKKNTAVKNDKCNLV